MKPLPSGMNPAHPTCEPNNHFHLADRRTLQSEHLINHLPCSNQQQQPHNPNIHLNNKETASIEQLRPVIHETSLLTTVLVEQSIIQAVISSIKTSDGMKSRLESWIALVGKCSTNFRIKHPVYSIFKNGKITPYFQLMT